MKTPKDPRRMECGDIAKLANRLTDELFGSADHLELMVNGKGFGGWSKPGMAGHIYETSTAFVNMLARKRRLKGKPA